MNCSNCKIANQNVPCIPQGNDFKIAIVLKEKIKTDGEVSERDIDIAQITSVNVIKPNGDAVDNTQNQVYSYALNGSTLILDFANQEGANALPKGNYGVDVKGVRDDADDSNFRFYLPPAHAFNIVNSTIDGRFPSDSIITYTVNGVVGVALNVSEGGGSSTEQVQSDWNETDASSKAYIKNKPTIYTMPQNGIPSSDLTSGVQTSLSKADSAMQRLVVVISYANNTYSSNKTYAQIVAAHNNGDEVIVTFNNFIYRLSNVGSSSVTFEMQNAANDIFSTIEIVNDDSISKTDSIIPSVSGKEDKLLLATALAANSTAEFGKYYRLAISTATTINLPAITGNETALTGFMIYLTINSGGSVDWNANNNETIMASGLSSIAEGKTYEVNAAWNGAVWAITANEFTAYSTT